MNDRLAIDSNFRPFRSIIKLWEWAKENLTIEEINKKLSFGTDNEGRTVWQLAAERGQLETTQKLWERSKNNVTIDDISNELLFAQTMREGPSGTGQQRGAI